MAINYTYSAPLSKPIDLSVNRTASGGTWSAGTYVFRVQTGNNSIYSKITTTSVISDPITIEVQDNDSLTFDFDPVDSSATNYQIFFEKEGHTTSGSWLWVNVNQGVDLIADLPTTFTAPYHPWYNYTYNEFHMYPYRNYGLSRDQGHFHLEITGNDTLTIESINDFLRTNASDQEGITWIDGRDKGLFVCGNIYAPDFTGTFSLDGVTIYNIRPIYFGDGCKWEMTNSTWINGNRNMSTTRDSISNYDITNSYIIQDRVDPQPAVYFGTTGTDSSIRNSLLDTQFANSDFWNYVGKLSKIVSGTRLDSNMQDYTIQAGAVYVKYAEGVIERCKFYFDLTSYMFLCAGNTAFNTDFRDCNFYSSVDADYQGYSWVIGDEFPLDYLAFTYPSTFYLYENPTGTGNIIFSNTVDLTIKDGNNNLLADVSVSIVDASGNTEFSGFTDSSGNINTYLQHLILEPTGNTTRGYNEHGLRKVNKNPYTISLSKSGYERITTILEVLEPINNNFVLKPPTYEDRVLLLST